MTTNETTTNEAMITKTDFPATSIERELQFTIDTPVGGLDQLLDAISESIPLRQGPYDCCLLVRRNCQQRFRALEGSHAGAENTIQQTEAAQVVFSIPADQSLLTQTFSVIFDAHVNEEPTIRITEVWGSRSKLLDDKDNPNRYWNKSDAQAIHGEAIDNFNDKTNA